ncbi:MAG: hypothetical protein P4L41_11945 [Flavipsychrobacter sp.]|nr:hypothetical protein [Flavipsychrobacter sp.]
MKYFFSLLFLFMAHDLWAGAPDSVGLKNVVITGNGFIFALKEPAGWECNTKTAEQYQANAILYANEDSIKSGGALVQLAVFLKQDEFTDKDLEENISSYRNEYSNLKEADTDIKHPTYRSYGKLEYVPSDFYQYIVFINPGQQYKYGFSVAMNIYKRPATTEELDAFKEIVSTLKMIKG